jgi:methylated-DNA-protein-cysteine methyltransferase-like protein
MTTRRTHESDIGFRDTALGPARDDSRETMLAEIYRIVEQIPPGTVTTYGRIAQMAGYYGASRMVGRAMSKAPPGLPCHRVVNAQGRTAPCWPEQRALLEAEGVSFKANGCVDLRKHLW